MPHFSELKRTHNCGELRPDKVGKAVRLNGWVNTYRNLGGLLFLDLRDRYGITQVVINPDTFDKQMLIEAERTRSEFVVAVTGHVRKRPDGTANPKLMTGEIDVVADSFHILSESKTPPFEITEKSTANEQLRLEYRYLDLRRKPLQDNLRLRHQVALAVRNYLSSVGFYEIETPLLMRSTPEGARDYVVPSRTLRGKFYALPQSPQLLKQILMVSGFDKYFQLARCLRDEDLRADRQPEHTQIDLEMSYVTPSDVWDVVEGMLAYVYKNVLGITIETPFLRLDYDEVMKRWGIDKPDLRLGMEIVDLSSLVKDSTFALFADNVKNGGVVKGIVLKGGGSYSRKQIDDLTVKAKEFGAGGLAYVLRTGGEYKSPIAKFLGYETIKSLCAHAKTEDGDALFIVSDKSYRAESILGQLRLNLGREHGMIKHGEYKFLWVTHFPLLDYNAETKGWDAMHNIVSHPVEADLALIDEGLTSKLDGSDLNHPWRRVKALQYDIVINGSEIGSGGQRINRRDLQEKILKILGIDAQRADRMFGFLLRALEYGAPPHAGIGMGLDRLISIIAGCDSIRDVIAFPKTANGSSPMDNSPSYIEQHQLDELGIIIKAEVEATAVLCSQTREK
ncbi:MAG: aspartate--tRNA ligase [candidate division Zixibacteria bacterium]|nr:aspartate--tRNA ligase [candidate division Zixibacteria bacterium]